MELPQGTVVLLVSVIVLIVVFLYLSLSACAQCKRRLQPQVADCYVCGGGHLKTKTGVGSICKHKSDFKWWKSRINKN